MRKDFSRGLRRNHAHICQAGTGRSSNLETSSQSLGEPRLSVSGEVQRIGQQGINARPGLCSAIHNTRDTTRPTDGNAAALRFPLAASPQFHALMQTRDAGKVHKPAGGFHLPDR